MLTRFSLADTLPSTLTAVTMPIFPRARVLGNVGMSVGAVRFQDAAESSSVILDGRDGLQVRGPAAPNDAAKMVQMEAVRNRTDRQLIRHDMSPDAGHDS